MELPSKQCWAAQQSACWWWSSGCAAWWIGHSFTHSRTVSWQTLWKEHSIFHFFVEMPLGSSESIEQWASCFLLADFAVSQLVQGWSSSQLPFKAPPEPKRRLADQDGPMVNRIKITSYYQISLDNLKDSFYMPSGSFRPFVMHLVSEVSDGRHVSLRRPQHIEFKILKKP